MRADAARADRHHAVRSAARSWKRAGTIEAATLTAIEAAYPDDRRRLGPIFRVVAFGFSFLALNAFLILIGVCIGNEYGIGIVCLLAAGVLATATEILTGPLRRADSGLETATALLSVGYVVVGLAFLAWKPLGSERALFVLILLMAAILSAIGSWRWGSPLLAAVAAVASFFLLARLSGGRALWIVVAMLAAPFLLRGSESAALPPAHRRSLLLCLLLALGAIYVAVQIGSWDYRWIEWIADFREAPPAPGTILRPLSMLATATLPVLILAFGIATRRTTLLNAGLLLGVASLITLRFYVHVAPLWVVLIASGSAALLAALLLRRLLVSGAGRERGGFTAEPLFQDPARRHLVEVAAAIVQLGPDARTIPVESDKFEAGGGSYGGGGASGDF